MGDDKTQLERLVKAAESIAATLDAMYLFLVGLVVLAFLSSRACK